MLTSFVLTSAVAGGLPVMLAPLQFRVLLDLRYPVRAGEADRGSRPIHDGFDAAPVRRVLHPEAARGHARRRTVRAHGNGPRGIRQPHSRLPHRRQSSG
jgi:hypothetical protein